MTKLSIPEGTTTFIHYVRDEYKRPVVSVASIFTDNGTVLARGVAVCSNMDNPNKKTGRLLATVRAYAAVHAKKNLLPIMRTLTHLPKAVNSFIYRSTIFDKAAYQPDTLTDFEARIATKFAHSMKEPV